MPWRWESFPEWLDALQALPKGVNVVSFVPVSSLMVYVMGLEAAKSRPATKAEQLEMQRLLNEAIDAGACGFSIQRLGEHSLQADYDGTPMPTDQMVDEDILVLADVLRERDEGFIQITQAASRDAVRSGDALRNEDHDFLERLAGRAQRPILHNAIAAIEDQPEFHERELAWVHKCNEEGPRMYAQGVMVRGVQVLDGPLEPVRQQPGLEPRDPRHRRGEARESLRPGAAACRAEGRGADARVDRRADATRAPECSRDPGPPRAREVHRDEGQRDRRGRGQARGRRDAGPVGRWHLKVVFRGGVTLASDPANLGEVMRDQYTLAGASDGGAHTKFITAGSFTTDFLIWLVRDTKQLSLEEAHYHLSYLPAQAAGLLDRGFLREGAPADIVVYDLENLKLTPESNYEAAHDVPANEWRLVQYSEGYRYTLVNGEITFEDGKCTGATPGLLLRNRQIGTDPLAVAAGR